MFWAEAAEVTGPSRVVEARNDVWDPDLTEA